MSCSPFDLKDFFLQELPDTARRQVEAHVKTCSSCRDEMDRLRLTEAALFALRDEEIPQRIAFVSDPVFERSPWRRWFDGFWGSAARLGFASATMLSTAILVFALTRPAPVPVINVPPPVVATVSNADVQRQIQAAVDQAVAASEKQTRQVIAELENARGKLVLAEAEFDRYQKESRRRYVADAGYISKPVEPGEPK